jgi:uncharacterized protein
VTVFVDTSALYALLDTADRNHPRAATTFEGLRDRNDLITHNYVVVESTALLHRRLGPAAARALLEDLVPVLRVVWIGAEAHSSATSAFLAAVRRRASLVDWVSFEVMRRERIESAFAFDADFDAQGFRTIP